MFTAIQSVPRNFGSRLWPSADSIMHETPSNRDVDQIRFEEQLLTDLGDKARLQNQQDVSILSGQVPTLPQLEQEFQKVAHDPAIPFEYITTGCASRAHLVCETLQKDHINCSKMFVTVDRPGQLTARNAYMEGGWWYHVAPLSFAENPQTHAVEPYILDPSVADHPLQPTAWIRSIWDAQSNLRIDVTRAAQLGPVEVDGLSQNFEEGLPVARQELSEHLAELRRIKEHSRAA